MSVKLQIIISHSIDNKKHCFSYATAVVPYCCYCCAWRVANLRSAAAHSKELLATSYTTTRLGADFPSAQQQQSSYAPPLCCCSATAFMPLCGCSAAAAVLALFLTRSRPCTFLRIVALPTINFGDEETQRYSIEQVFSFHCEATPT